MLGGAPYGRLSAALLLITLGFGEHASLGAGLTLRETPDHPWLSAPVAEGIAPFQALVPDVEYIDGKRGLGGGGRFVEEIRRTLLVPASTHHLRAARNFKLAARSAKISSQPARGMGALRGWESSLPWTSRVTVTRLSMERIFWKDYI